MIDFTILDKLLEMLNSSHAGSIEVRKTLWSTTIRVSKDVHFGNAGSGVTYQVSAPPALSAAALSGAAPPARSKAAGAAEAAEPRRETVDVKSPMVGTFYAQPEPGAQPYVQAGSRVAPGQTLCIIEAMKIMNPIEAEVSGAIVEICVQDAQPVEFGQVLFRVDPHG